VRTEAGVPLLVQMKLELGGRADDMLVYSQTRSRAGVACYLLDQHQRARRDLNRAARRLLRHITQRFPMAYGPVLVVRFDESAETELSLTDADIRLVRQWCATA